MSILYNIYLYVYAYACDMYTHIYIFYLIICFK